MSNNLNLTYRTSVCKGFTPSTYPILTPSISSLSSYYSIVGSTTLITIVGDNFREFSIVKLGGNTVNSNFISSTQISFYVPYNYSYGTYSIQVFNDNYGSNVVDFTIDNNGSYWVLTPGTNAINNINTGDINMYCSVFANYLNSYSIPGAFLYTSNNFIYPIYRSVSSYSDFYQNSSSSNTNSSTTPGYYLITTGTSYIPTINDSYYIVSPGYQLIVYQNTTITLKASNLSFNPLMVSPTVNTNTSCQLYFWSNSIWNII
jgi:hypothetical protein